MQGTGHVSHLELHFEASGQAGNRCPVTLQIVDNEWDVSLINSGKVSIKILSPVLILLMLLLFLLQQLTMGIIQIWLRKDGTKVFGLNQHFSNQT